MIYEVLKRRLRHKEWGLPHLILIDGGKIQLKFALMSI
jgi:excinuclease UvrABC nuclease subunit